ncbi:hypothetical protein [Nocardioides sp. MH1]|uniref:hypothetical protein n=1 Tax=Nocardioides sp. MH1 TaxID=3242490 RepID=UPI0035204AB4
MSAFSIGGEASTTHSNAGGRQPTKAPASGAPATFVKWIPGEAITFYAAVLGLGASQGELTGNETPRQLLQRIDASSPGWFFLGAGLAAALVVAGAWTGGPSTRTAGKVSRASVCARVSLTLVSFLIWATALPGAWPSGWHVVQDMGDAYALFLVPLAALFSALALAFTQRWDL